MLCPRHEKDPPQHGKCLRKITCPRRRSADKSGVLKARRYALAHGAPRSIVRRIACLPRVASPLSRAPRVFAAVKDAQIKASRKDAQMLIDVRVAGAIARQSNSLTMAAGTARLTAASQLMATTTAALLGEACLSMRRLRRTAQPSHQPRA